ncbi:MAG: hypothetical protein AAGK14_13120 [Verrucomicrobiota bacterium]
MKLLHADADAGTLQLIRQGVLALALLVVAGMPAETLTAMPLWAYEPLGPFRLLPAGWWEVILSFPFLVGLRITLAALLTAALLLRPGGWWIAVTMAASWLLVFLLSLPRGFADFSHPELSLAILLLALPWFALADRLQARCGRPSPPAHTLVPLTLLFLLTYVLPGVRRVFSMGAELFNPEHTWAWMTQHLHEAGALGPFDAAWLDASPLVRWSLAAGFPFITLLELLAPLALVSRPFRLVFLVAMLAFHAGSILLYRLYFLENMALLVLLLIAWGQGSARRKPQPAAAR